MKEIIEKVRVEGLNSNYLSSETEDPHIDPLGREYYFKVIMYCYSIGKEEICVELARFYNTKVVVDKERYKMIRAIAYHPDLFTTDPKNGFIYLSKGLNSSHSSDSSKIIHINLTGWVNCKTYFSTTDRQYQVAYSSHSNFNELENFVSLIKPSVISPIVIEREEEMSGKSIGEKSFESNSTYLFWLRNLKKKGLTILSYVIRTKIRGSAFS